MGLRFRRSIKIAPGVRLNVGSKSWGISTGSRGARISTNSKSGTHVSVGIPGTGLSYRQKIGATPKQSGQDSSSPGHALGGCLVLLFAINPLIGCGSIVVGIVILCFITSLAINLVAGLLAVGIRTIPVLITIGITRFVAVRNESQSKSELTKFLDISILATVGLIAELIYLWVFFIKK